MLKVMVFCHSLKNLVINMVKILDTATKAGIDAAKIADKVTLIVKRKEKERTKEIKEIYIPRKKRQLLIDYLRLF